MDFDTVSGFFLPLFQQKAHKTFEKTPVALI